MQTEHNTIAHFENDLTQDLRIVPSSSLIVGIVGACEAGVGRVDAVAGVFWGVGADARSSTRLFLMYCFSDIVNCRLLNERTG